MAKLRMSLTVPGAVSLGAYEGGALAALLNAALTLGDDVLLIDSIAAASAGSITGLLAARALLRGTDPVALLSACWVDDVSIKALKPASADDSPLSSTALTGIAQRVLGPGGVADQNDRAGFRRTESVRLSMALASLAGLSYEIPVESGDPIPASTYLDWFDVEATSAFGSDDYLRSAAGAIASGANAMGFPPRLVDRSDIKDKLVADGLVGFPPDGKFWYTDGGTVSNEPLGRTINLAQAINSDDDRLYLLIHHNAAYPSATPQPPWSGDSPQPSWLKTGTRAFSMGRAQTIYDDLRRLEQTNVYLGQAGGVSAAITAGVEAATAALKLSAEDAATLASTLTDAVVQQLAKLPNPSGNPTPTELAPAIDDLVHAATGLGGKDLVRVEVVSPLVGHPETDPKRGELAGAFLFDFGGFFDLTYRQSDFALGYRNMQYWLNNELAAYLPGVDLSGMTAALQAAYDKLGWDNIRRGGATINDLSLGGKLDLLELAGHAGRVVERDVREKL